jgi:hypothetical protein
MGSLPAGRREAFRRPELASPNRELAGFWKGYGADMDGTGPTLTFL